MIVVVIFSYLKLQLLTIIHFINDILLLLYFRYNF